MAGRKYIKEEMVANMEMKNDTITHDDDAIPYGIRHMSSLRYLQAEFQLVRFLTSSSRGKQEDQKKPKTL